MRFLLLLIVSFVFSAGVYPQVGEVYAGADESSPSRAQYFSWINNTNEGTTATHTLINLDFFAWLKREYGMQLDIYAFDAGAIDGKRFYGNINSDRFKKQFPSGFTPIYRRADDLGIRLGIWGGPDGFGNTEAEAAARIEQMTSLCRDYKFALFKFDAVCGPLRPEKEDYFIEMMEKARQYSPDLILLNHRLGLKRAKPYATTFLWEGAETYIDVFMNNRVTAPHHRAAALSRGLVPGLMRLTEDHGVCISSCIDYWDDDLILQAFNRNLILSPQIYGNPWLMRDDEFPRLARIFNMHRKYRDILTEGLVLPDRYGPYAVSRGDGKTQIITLRNLSWEPRTYSITLNEETGLKEGVQYHLRQFHPVEKVMGIYPRNDRVEITVDPFRSYMLVASSEKFTDAGIIGCDYYVISNIEGENIEIDLLGMPGTSSYVQLENSDRYTEVLLDNVSSPKLLRGRVIKVEFPGKGYSYPLHRMLGTASETDLPADADALYEATVFAADNNALEIRSLYRSGPTEIKEVKAARDAFLNQEVFIDRGIWDKNLFDGDMNTAFFPSRKYKKDQKVKGGCFRLDLGNVSDIDSLVIYVQDDYSLQPLLSGEGNYVEISPDLISWQTLTYTAGKKMLIYPGTKTRYFRFREYPDRINEIEAYKDGKIVNNENFRASNLFAHPRAMKPVKAWKAVLTIDEIADNSYLSVAINGKHGIEGAYAAIKCGNTYIGAPDRARSYPSNTWEYINAAAESNYTYYFPVDNTLEGREIEVYILGYNENITELKPEIWISASPQPFKRIRLTLKPKNLK